ncbi:MAG: mechanosensitive ion channel [Lachnospiraceae bacterium]|nr:mechanosensitive ion channel [Lachnospiraceae bacterium]
MWEYLRNLCERLVNGLGGVIAAILLLVLAFIVSAIVKALITGALKKTKLRYLNQNQVNPDGSPALSSGQGLINYIGKLVYLCVFLLFVPGIFSTLGVNSVMEPLNSLLHTVWGYVPNILAAGIVLVVGSLIAKLVRELLVPVFQKIRLDKIQEKAGIEVDNESKLSVTLAYIIYVLIMIPVVIVSLQALNITAVSQPAVEMLGVVFSFIPQLVIAIVLIWVGVLIGKYTGRIVAKLIASAGADAKIRELAGEKSKDFRFSKTVGTVVTVVLDIFFIVEGMNVLNLSVLTGVGSRVISYMPSVLASVLILACAFLMLAAVEKALKKSGLEQYTIFSRAAILILAAFMVLNQLGIAATIVNTAFVIILAAVGVAFAVAFGIGGRKFAADTLEKLEKRGAESGENTAAAEKAEEKPAVAAEVKEEKAEKAEEKPAAAAEVKEEKTDVPGEKPAAGESAAEAAADEKTPGAEKK